MSDESPGPLPPPPADPTPSYNLAVADTASKNSVALVRFTYADKGNIKNIYTEYLNQKINEL